MYNAAPAEAADLQLTFPSTSSPRSTADELAEPTPAEPTPAAEPADSTADSTADASQYLTREEVNELARRIKPGVRAFQRPDGETELRIVTADARAAVSVLVARNQGFVHLTANKLAYHYKMDQEDFVQEANMGLVVAALRYDPDKGYHYLSYAGWWIKALTVRRATADYSLVKIGTTAWQRRGFMKGLGGEDVVLSSGRAPTTRAPMSIRAMKRDLSIHAREPGTEGGESRAIEDELTSPDDTEEIFSSVEHRAHLRDIIEDALAKLPWQQAFVLRARFYPEEGIERMTLEVVGAKFNVSRERVRQIQVRGLATLKRELHADRRVQRLLEEGAFGRAEVHERQQGAGSRKT